MSRRSGINASFAGLGIQWPATLSGPSPSLMIGAICCRYRSCWETTGVGYLTDPAVAALPGEWVGEQGEPRAAAGPAAAGVAAAAIAAGFGAAGVAAAAAGILMLKLSILLVEVGRVSTVVIVISAVAATVVAIRALATGPPSQPAKMETTKSRTSRMSPSIHELSKMGIGVPSPATAKRQRPCATPPPPSVTPLWQREHIRR